MSLYNQIQNDMYSAMKSGNKEETNTLRTTLAKLKNKKIEKQKNLNKEEEIKVLMEHQINFKEEIEKNKGIYEKIIDEAADKIEDFIQKANSDRPIQ